MEAPFGIDWHINSKIRMVHSGIFYPGFWIGFYRFVFVFYGKRIILPKKTQCIKKLLDLCANRVTVEHIPPYSPELNPIEACWKATKNSVTKPQYFLNLDEMQFE